ncbi:MAG: glycosyltransferase family 2 protein [Candidatus Eremiobacteraeota bacterium]|nr:glycosyltransferase family 2 protein [Candidatus Eremiobacteraeota bacterium]
MSVSLVTVTHNRKDYLLDLLESAYGGTLVPDEVIVVDNASADKTAAAVRRRFPSVRLIENSTNRLVSAAFNSGLACASGDFLIAIADDNVLASDCIEQLVDGALRHPEAGAIGPTMYYFDAPDKVWFAGIRLSLTTGHTAFRQLASTTDDGVVETDCIPNCLLITRRALETVGFLDENAFPMHHEEADYCLRCRHAGLKVYVALRAREWHRVEVPRRWVWIGSGDFNIDDPMRAYYNARSRVFLAKRHASRTQLLVYACVFLPLFTCAYMIISILTMSGRRGGDVAAAFLRGTIHGIAERVPPYASPRVAGEELLQSAVQ